MAINLSADHLRFLVNRFRERLWVKPLAVCLLSIGAVFVSKLADDSSMADFVPEVTEDSIETLLSIMAASMMVIATFSVASMVSAYASASSTATPRSFNVVVTDDASQNALSTFVGAFIFSIVGITAVKNNYFGSAALFILFSLSIFVFALVIFTFVRWVDRIARLGRMGSTIDKVEQATARALQRRRDAPALCGVTCTKRDQNEDRGHAVFAPNIGYVQHIDMSALQTWAEDNEVRIEVASLPGAFAAPGRTLAYVRCSSASTKKIDCQCVESAFQIGADRLFDDDPRFGLVVLAEIAGRALSPGVNDPGTAINVLGTLVRLFDLWSKSTEPDQALQSECNSVKYDRVEVPEIALDDMFEDAFTVIARDGAGTVEVAVWLQKALHSLSLIDAPDFHSVATHHAKLAMQRARSALTLPDDLRRVEQAADFTLVFPQHQTR